MDFVRVNSARFFDQLRKFPRTAHQQFWATPELVAAMETILQNVAHTGLVFDFGKLYEHGFKSAASIGEDMLNAGVVQMPMNDPFIMTVEACDVGKTPWRYTILVLDHGDGGENSERFLYTFRHTKENFVWVAVTQFDIDTQSFRHEDGLEGYSDLAISLLKTGLGILNTKGVQWETKETKSKGSKLYKVGYHKPCGQYFAALKAGSARSRGQAEPTGLSVRPHIRRGHIRNLPSGKTVWVNSCLVNVANEDELPFMDRLGYKA